MQKDSSIEKLEIENYSNINQNNNSKENKCTIPSTHSILLFLGLLIFILTYIIPKGKYDTIEYSSKTKSFIIHSYNEEDKIEKGTESTLLKYNIKISISNFIDESIKGPISIPNTYKRIKYTNYDFFSFFLFPIKGIIESCDLIIFIMTLGGIVKILNSINALNSGIKALANKTKGKEFLLISLIFIIISIGGTSFGMCEETIPLYPILMPIFLKNDLDSLLGMSCVFVGSSIGTMFSTVNAFAVVIASYSAGINFIDGIIFRIITFVIADCICILFFYYYYVKIKKNKENSIVYNERVVLREIFIKNETSENDKKEDDEKGNINKNENNEKNESNNNEIKYNDNNKNNNKEFNEFTLKHKLSLLFFVLGFPLTIIGVIFLKWWFQHMQALFLIIAIIIIFISGIPEENAVKLFLEGGGEFLGVVTIIGLAKGINKLLNDGLIADTILYTLSNLVKNLPKQLFIIILFIIFIILGLFIQSSSALAVLSMPIMAPLADDVKCSRKQVINAYMFGQNFADFFTPTGFILIILEIVGIKFNFWFKFIWPLLVILFVYLIVILIIGTYID